MARRPVTVGGPYKWKEHSEESLCHRRMGTPAGGAGVGKFDIGVGGLAGGGGAVGGIVGVGSGE